MSDGRRRLEASGAAFLLARAACQPAPSGPPPTAGSSDTVTTAPSSTVAPSPAATVDRAAGWRSDLARIVPGMDALHPDLEHGVSIEAMTTAVDELAASVEDASDDALMVGVARVAAMVSATDGRDGHTGLFAWGTGSYPVESLPLRLWLFEDEVAIVGALPPYEDLVDASIVSIEGRPIAEVLAALDPIIPRDNAQTVRLLSPRFLLMPQILRGLGIAGVGPIAVGVSLADGTEDVRIVQPVPIAEYNAWAGPYGLHLPVDADVLSLARIGDALWWQVMPDTRTLYVQYNRVDDQPPSTLGELEAALGDADIERVILDVRHNYGGELRALDAIEPFFAAAAAAHPGEFFVITGRNTFSAGSMLVAHLDAGGDVTIVGEATGGAPTFWGNSRELVLPWSGLSISVSTTFEVGVDPDDPRDTIEPAQIAILDHEDWGDGIDRALESIIIVAP
jgi:hypothetical protein